MAVRRRNAPARPRRRETTERGTGTGEYEVKGQRATALQRRVINGCLAQAEKDNASRRVMIATIMCITQESGAGAAMAVMTGDDDVGIFQQGRPWISVAGAKDPAKSTHAFLITGPTSWKKRHGGVKNAPGSLTLAIHKVQGNANPNDYAQWEGEATKTVDAWLGGDHSDGGGSYTKRYTFSRGERRGEKEDSWEAADRLVKEVGGYRWAAGNVFHVVSGEELRRGAPSLTIQGDEGWIRNGPAWSWASRRSLSEVTLDVLADHWDVMPGGSIVLHQKLGAMSGRWLVFNISGPSLESPEAQIVLRRPTAFRPEPRSETVNTSNSGDGDAAGGSGVKVKNTYPGSPVPGQRYHTATHQTAGLAGYPAFDYMAPAGTPCVAPADGKIDRLSGSAPGGHCQSGGACGYSIYMSGGGKSYFLTHIDKVSVKVGDQVKQGEQIAEIANGPRHWSTPHVHMGVRG